MNLEKFHSIVSPLTMTSKERITELYNSLEWIRKEKIQGDFVECGVWKGGNILGIMEYLQYHQMSDRRVWLYDTFQGMTEPTEKDIDHKGEKAINILESVKCYSPLQEVKSALNTSNFPESNTMIIQGDVLDTLQVNENLPKKIALLRLDTDWYESTKMELEILYPLVETDGVLIVDDYGHWQGSKLATDEYFQNRKSKIDFKQIDYTGILILKNE
jgi:O-methyltransferase